MTADRPEAAVGRPQDQISASEVAPPPLAWAPRAAFIRVIWSQWRSISRQAEMLDLFELGGASLRAAHLSHMNGPPIRRETDSPMLIAGMSWLNNSGSR